MDADLDGGSVLELTEGVGLHDGQTCLSEIEGTHNRERDGGDDMGVGVRVACCAGYFEGRAGASWISGCDFSDLNTLFYEAGRPGVEVGFDGIRELARTTSVQKLVSIVHWNRLSRLPQALPVNSDAGNLAESYGFQYGLR